MECVNADECSPLTANAGANKCTDGCDTASLLIIFRLNYKFIENFVSDFGKKENENYTECAFCSN